MITNVKLCAACSLLAVLTLLCGARPNRADVLRRKTASTEIQQFRTEGFDNRADRANCLLDSKAPTVIMYTGPKCLGNIWFWGYPYYIFRELADTAGVSVASMNAQGQPDEGDYSFSFHLAWGFSHGNHAIIAAGADVVMLHPLMDTTPKIGQAAGVNWYRLALYGNPECRVYFYGLPPSISSRGSFWPDYERGVAKLDESLCAIIDAAAAEYGTADKDQKPCLVPVGYAEVELLRFVKAGQVPGFAEPKDLGKEIGRMFVLSDAPTFAASYFDALVRYAVLLKKNPIGLPASLHVKHKAQYRSPVYMATGKASQNKFVADIDLNPEAALVFQKVAWWGAVTHPYSGVAAPVDTTPPSKPAGVTVADGVVTWKESTDAESGVYKYIVQRSDGKTFETVLPKLVDPEAKAGGALKYAVTAVNYAGLDDAGRRVWTVPARAEVSPKFVLSPSAVDRQAAFKAAPAIRRVTARDDLNKVLIEFAGKVDAAAAMNPANYRIEPQIEVRGVREGWDEQTFILKTSDLKKEGAYTLAAGGAKTPFTCRMTPWKFRSGVGWWWARMDLASKIIFYECAALGMRSQRQLRALGMAGDPDEAELGRYDEVQLTWTSRWFHEGYRMKTEGNEFASVYRDDLTGDFDFRAKVIWYSTFAPGRLTDEERADTRVGIVVANDLLDLKKGGYAYVALCGDQKNFELGYVDGAKPDAQPDEINTHVRKPVPARDDPQWTWSWLRLKKSGRAFSAYYWNENLEACPKESGWVLIGTFQTMNVADRSHVGTFGTSGWVGPVSVSTLQLGPESWRDSE